MSLSPTAARSPGITDWVRAHRAAVFFGLTFLLSWWAWPFYLVGLAPTAFFPCGPLVAAIVVVGVTEGARRWTVIQVSVARRREPPDGQRRQYPAAKLSRMLTSVRHPAPQLRSVRRRIVGRAACGPAGLTIV